MNRRWLGFLLLLAVLPLAARGKESVRIPFNQGWTFLKDGQERIVDLPHDWGVEGPFRIEYPGETGKLPWWGRAIYRKTLSVTKEEQADNLRFYLDLDGVMSGAEVFCNGERAGAWPYGYASFRVDLTPHLQAGDNLLEIAVDNPEESSRWYPGGGIYRDVFLEKAPAAGIAHWGVFVTATSQGRVRVAVCLRNAGPEQAGTLTVSLRERALPGTDAAAGTLAETRRDIPAVAEGMTVVEELSLPRPRLWSCEDPYLYEAVVSLGTGDGTDVCRVPFGIRTAEFREDGFYLNGEKTFLKGVCLHHDAGALGAVWSATAWERRLRKLQEMGCNAIRTAHNPPAPGLLDLCDRMGFLVMDELTDTWTVPKKPNGYARLFDEWAEKDLTALIRRDRNHPCVILWSIGNEVGEQGYPDKYPLAQALTDLCHREDSTRLTTYGCDNPWASTQPGWVAAADVYGFNYKPHLYAEFHEAFPDKPYLGSETASCISTRGFYVFPVEEDQAGGLQDFQVSSYDLYAPWWAGKPDTEWEGEDRNPSCAGEFVWTGFDYLGEPTPYNADLTVLTNFHDPVQRQRAEEELARLGKIASPARSSYFGIFDLAGFPKDRFWLYQARWRPDLPMAHILPHWNWAGREGEVTPVHVYTSGDSAELFVNGRSQGLRTKGPYEYRLRWDDVRYEPGRVKVVVYKDGKRWASDRVRTTGPARRIRLRKEDLPADDLLFIEARVTDRRGHTVPTAADTLSFSLEGPGEIVATDAGDPTSLVPFSSPEKAALAGLCSVVVRRTGPGRIILRGTAPGLRRAKITLK